MPRTTKAAPAPERNKAHATPRRIISMSDDLWMPLQQLAETRYTNASALVREAIRALLDGARAAGELPPARKRGAR